MCIYQQERKHHDLYLVLLGRSRAVLSTVYIVLHSNLGVYNNNNMFGFFL